VPDDSRYTQVLQALLARGVPEGYDPDRVSATRWPCPVHGGSDTLALSDNGNGQDLVYCHAGCSYEEIIEALDLDFTPAGCTVETLAEHLGLPEDWLEDAEWTDSQYGGRSRVEIPYPPDPVTGNVRIRRRVSLDGKEKFQWPRGTKVKGAGLLYAGDELAHCRDQAAILVEGESDALTVKRGAGYYTVGLPGATMWDERAHAPQFADVRTIFVVIEPDKGGAALVKSLASSEVRDKVRVIKLPSVKDARDLYVQDPATFRERFDAALAEAVTLDQVDAEGREEEAHLALSEAGDLPGQADLLGKMLDLVRRQGHAGESSTLVGVFLALTSVLTSRPSNVGVGGPSAGGKNEAVKRVFKLFPDSYYKFLTAMSEKALVHSTDDWRHRVLILAEAHGLGGDFANYVIRSILSEGQIIYLVAEKDPSGALVAVEKVVAGPTGLIASTTALKFHPENETRILRVSINDSQEQTAAVMSAIAEAHERVSSEVKELEQEVDRWRAFFRWQRALGLPAVVSVPYASALSVLIPPVAVRLRRDFSTRLGFIEAHALLHRASRGSDEHGRVIATLDDYAAVRHHLGDYFSEAVEQTVSADVRATVAAVEEAISQHGHMSLPDGLVPRSVEATVTEVSQALGLERTTTSRRVQAAVALGYVKNLEDRERQPARLALDQPLPLTDDRHLLPTVEELDAKLKEKS